MGTCFSFIKRNAKMKRRLRPHYCLTPRSFYQHDMETVELQYLVSIENNNPDNDAVDNSTLPGAIGDINENISCSSKRTNSNKKRRFLTRLLSWLELENDNSRSSPPPTEGDMMLSMMMSNSNYKITVQQQQDENIITDNPPIDNDAELSSNSKSNLNNGFNVTTPGCHNLSWAYNKSTFKSTLHSNFKNISCCSSKAPSNSNSNTSSIDLEWEPEGQAAALSAINKSNKMAMYQQQSSEDSVEVSLLSSAESLEWDSCEASGVILDSDTEQLIQEIERLTARALKETGCDYDFELDNGNTSTSDNDSYTNR